MFSTEIIFEVRELMLRSFPENPQFRPNILGQQASINHKIASHRVTSVREDEVGPVAGTELRRKWK